MKTAAKPVPVSVAATSSGYVLKRGSEDMRTPAGAALAVPKQALAETIAAEWNGQGDKIKPASMPFTQLAMTAIDVVGKDRAKAIDTITAYAVTELLCHRAGHPPELEARQEKLWQPLLDWCAEHFHAPLVNTIGLMPIRQLPTSIAVLRKFVEGLDAFFLAGLQQAVEVSGSLVIGLALMEGCIDAIEALNAAECDAGFQTEKWGDDPASAARRESIRRDLSSCEKWFGLLEA